jgi:hypothetical protein
MDLRAQLFWPREPLETRFGVNGYYSVLIYC